MIDAPNNSARPTPEGSSRAVLFKGEGWKSAAGWSVVTFALSLGIGVIVWSWFLDGGEIWGSGLMLRRGWRAKKAVTQVVEMPVPEIGAYRRAINGARSVLEEDANMKYVAVMIDNIPVARPQAGIADAAVVYEAPVEGGLTRLMAVFPENVSLEKIGPIRSARPYFIDWALEYDALYTHVGGSPEALNKIKAVGIHDLNEMLTGGFFWRDGKREAPHNVYTSGTMLKDAFAKRFKDRERLLFRGWKFKDDADRAERADAHVINISFDHPKIDVVWAFDADTDTYIRKQGNKVLDEGGAEVRAKDVVVLYMKTQTIDAVGRQKIETVGSGDALFALDGNTYHGTWKKASKGARTLFYDAGGNEMVLNAGQIWVQVVDVDAVVTVSP